ncbi:MAG: hypothetical protein E6J02_07010 [Chloroflexi bacterium]|nr:MAG: hypothetical protein E6J02_07010 [Chloroflexota bacterium]TME19344.1 MAG: hypothetical protein E6I63_00320 [Chloroflexota bacterium]
MRTLTLLGPEAVVVAAAVASLLSPALRPRQRAWLPAAASLAVVLALGLELWFGAQVGTLFQGGFSQDRFALYAKGALLLTALIIVAATDWDPFTAPAGIGLTLLATFGGMVAASAGDLIGLWAGLELAGLSAAVLLGRTDRLAARQLLLASVGLGGLVAVGMALLAGSGGTTVLADLRGQLFQHSLTLPLALAALLVVGALTARLALAPWAGPLATGTAGIVLLKMAATTSALSPSWALYVPAVAAVAMVGGGLAALAARRPGPSLVGAGMVQLGWFLASLAVPDRFGIAAGLFLLSAYLLAAAGGPIALAALPHGLAGLAERGVGRAVAFTACYLSLAGVPPLAGFFGQFAVAAELARAGLFWLIALGVFGSALLLFAALRDVRLAFLTSPGEQVFAAPRDRLTFAGALLAAALVSVYGFLALPVSSLALQGAAAIGLR